MAGGAQGGGGRPAPTGQPGQQPPVGQPAPPQFNPQAAQQYQNALQMYRQGSAGMPSQVPGANAAAPGGMGVQGGPQLNPQPQPAAYNTFAPQGAPSAPPQAPPQGAPTAPQGQMPQISPAILQQLQARGVDLNRLMQDYHQNLAAQQGQQGHPGHQGFQGPQGPQRPPMGGGFGDGDIPIQFEPRAPRGMPQVQGNPNAMPVQRPPQMRGNNG